MKVVFIPECSIGNPYQKCLADSLSKYGVDVRFGNIFRLLSVLRSIQKYWKPDILHIHWMHPLLLADNIVETTLKSIIFNFELIIKLLGIKIIWTVHNIKKHEEQYSHLELFFRRHLKRICDKIIVHSNFAKYEIMKVYKITDESLIVVIPHGNYINCYKNFIKNAKARSLLKISATDFVFLYFGLIRPYKGIIELIEAFNKLNAQQAKLLIVGKPIDDLIANDILNKCVGNKRIKLVNKFIPDSEVQIYMNSSDIVVLPYKEVLISGIAILAISFGKPIIAPTLGCIPDVLDKEGSFLYNPLEEDGLLKSMKNALGGNLTMMGMHNFQLATKFNWEEIAIKTYNIYQCVSRQSIPGSFRVENKV